jgi:hypothetical protein
MNDHPNLYKRDQVERSIAALSGRVLNAQYRPEPSLLADLKRLLDRDRTQGIQNKKGARSRYAFFDASPPGKGVDQTYGFEAAFALLAAERLLRAGCTQQRAVMRIRAARPSLDRKIRQILAGFSDKGSDRSPRLGALPYKPQPGEMIFWITTEGPAADLDMHPETFCPADKIKDVLVRSAGLSEPTISLELVTPVLGLRHWLARMPVRKRGRS